MSAVQTQLTTEAIIGQMPAVRIVSVTPLAFRKQMQYTYTNNGQSTPGFKWYELPAATRGEWTYCDVAPVMIYIPEFQEDNPQPIMSPRYADPVIRASDLVKDWAPIGHIPDFGAGGSFGIEALPPGGKEPSAELLRTLTARNEDLANRFMAHANDLHRKGKANSIQTRHRAMVKWLLGNGAESLDWYGLKDFAALKPCPMCSKQIAAMALRCEHCQGDVLDWYLKYGLEPENDPHAASVLAKVRAKQQPQDDGPSEEELERLTAPRLGPIPPPPQARG